MVVLATIDKGKVNQNFTYCNFFPFFSSPVPQPAEHPSRQCNCDCEHHGSGHHGRVRVWKQLQDGRGAGHRVRLHGLLDCQAARMRTYDHVILNSLELCVFYSKNWITNTGVVWENVLTTPFLHFCGRQFVWYVSVSYKLNLEVLRFQEHTFKNLAVHFVLLSIWDLQLVNTSSRLVLGYKVFYSFP